MKTWTKVFALLIAVMMVFSLTAPVLAVGEGETYTLTINGQYTGHTYEAYQVFKGTYTEAPVYKEDSTGEYYKLNDGTYTKIAPTAATYEDYVGVEVVEGEEGAEPTYTATKYSPVYEYVRDSKNGTWYKLKNGTYTETEPTAATYEDYEDVEVVVTGEGESEVTTYKAVMYTHRQKIKKGLKNIVWGTGVDGDALLAALKGITEGALYVAAVEDEEGNVTEPGYSLFKDCENAADVADVLKTFDDNQAQIDAFANIVSEHLTTTYETSEEGAKNPDGTYKYTISGLDTGYYFVKDKDVPDNETATKYMLEVVQSLEITAKADKPTLEKNIFRPAKADETATHYELKDGTFTDVAPTPETIGDYVNTEKTHVKVKHTDANIGDTIPYVLETTVPVMDGYKSYTFTVIDDMSRGLTFNNDVVIILNGKTLTAGVDYTVTSVLTETGTKITIDFINFIQYKGTEDVGKPIVITYSATVNENATVGNVGNENAAKLKFSSDPYSNVTGETPESKTYVYVTKIKLIKIDGDTGATLTGAKFQIRGLKKDIVMVNDEVFEKLTNGYYLLNDGTYTTDEPTEDTKDDYQSTTDQYKKVEEYVKLDPEADADYEGDIYYLLKDGTYTTEVPTEETEEKYESKTDRYKKVDTYEKLTVYYRLTDGKYTTDVATKDTAEKYESTTDKYIKVTFTQPLEGDTHEFVAEGYVDKDGILRFTGLGEGTYTITELIAPSGYNSLKEDIEVTIKWNKPTGNNATCTWDYKTKDSTEFVTDDDGIIELEVKNYTGTTLPSTGGIGTTIFYVLGAILAVGAVIILVTKKRMGEDNAR